MLITHDSRPPWRKNKTKKNKVRGFSILDTPVIIIALLNKT